MAYGQWINLIFSPKNFTLGLHNAHLEHGKWYVCGNKDIGLDRSVIDKVRINAGQSEQICSCGKSWAIFGTDGGFDVYDEMDGKSPPKRIANIGWKSVAGSRGIFQITPINLDYYYNVTPPINVGSGALGAATITFLKYT